MVENKPKLETLVHGGLHLEDFEWAEHRYESMGYALVAFVLDSDRYHWRAVFLKAEQVPVCKLKVLLEQDFGPAITPGQRKLRGLDESSKSGE